MKFRFLPAFCLFVVAAVLMSGCGSGETQPAPATSEAAEPAEPEPTEQAPTPEPESAEEAPTPEPEPTEQAPTPEPEPAEEAPTPEPEPAEAAQPGSEEVGGPTAPWSVTAAFPETFEVVAAPSGPGGSLAVLFRGDFEENRTGLAIEAGGSWLPIPLDALGGEAMIETRSDSGLFYWEAAHADGDGYAIVSTTQTWTSADGSSWDGPFANPPGVTFAQVIRHDDGGHLGVGWTEDDLGAVMFREAGGEWITAWSGNAADSMSFSLDAVTAMPSGYVAVGDARPIGDDAVLEQRRPFVLASSDGLVWEEREIAGDFEGRGGVLTSVVWSDALGALVAAGWDGIGSQEQRAIVFRSADGTSWEQVIDPAFDVAGPYEQIRDLVATDVGVLAVGVDQYFADNAYGLVWILDATGVWSRSEIVNVDDGVYMTGVISVDGERCEITGESEVGGTIWAGPCSEFVTE